MHIGIITYQDDPISRPPHDSDYFYGKTEREVFQKISDTLKTYVEILAENSAVDYKRNEFRKMLSWFTEVDDPKQLSLMLMQEMRDILGKGNYPLIRWGEGK